MSERAGAAWIRIEELPIDQRVKQLYLESGISELYPPQEEAVLSGVLQGKNLVLAVPTASGKTMVAELCAAKAILERGGKVLYLVPLRALASEKYDEFKKFNKVGIKVVLSSGDYDSLDPTLGRYDLIIATNEKADSLFRHRPAWVDRLTLVVADEIHLMGDASRGPTLEAILTKIRLLNLRAQILALSATISNADEISEWLGAALVSSAWRPVPLNEGVYCRGSITFKDGSVKGVGESGTEKDPVADLTVDVLRSGGQMLIFTGSRLSTVSLAKRLEAPVGRLLKLSEERKLAELSSRILKLGERTRISDNLAKSVSFGVAFHHAGLTYPQRKAIEDAFRAFLVKCICATPTLAAGVNTPARRVLIYDYRRFEAGVGRSNIPVLEEKQMAGRAGRPKYDSSGEAILFARSEDEKEFLFDQYILAKPEKVWSKLGVANALRSHTLAAIATGLATSKQGVFDFLEKSFCAYQYGLNSFRSSIIESVNMLEDSGMIKFMPDGSRVEPTPLGKRVSELYIDPLSANALLEGLGRRLSGLPPMSYLTLICHTTDMPKFFVRKKEIDALEAFLESSSDLLLYDLPEEKSFDYEMILSEIKTAMLLKEWVDETPEERIVDAFDVGSGDIYAYVESAKWLLHASHELARLLGYEESLRPLRNLLIRVENGIREELIPLISLKGIGRVRARALFSAGYRSIDALKRATAGELGRIPQIGPETIKSIKEQIGGTVTAEEWSRMRSKKGTKQLSIEDYDSGPPQA